MSFGGGKKGSSGFHQQLLNSGNSLTFYSTKITVRAGTTGPGPRWLEGSGWRPMPQAELKALMPMMKIAVIKLKHPNASHYISLHRYAFKKPYFKSFAQIFSRGVRLTIPVFDVDSNSLLFLLKSFYSFAIS